MYALAAEEQPMRVRISPHKAPERLWKYRAAAVCRAIEEFGDYKVINF